MMEDRVLNDKERRMLLAGLDVLKDVVKQYDGFLSPENRTDMSEVEELYQKIRDAEFVSLAN